MKEEYGPFEHCHSANFCVGLVLHMFYLPTFFAFLLYKV